MTRKTRLVVLVLLLWLGPGPGVPQAVGSDTDFWAGVRSFESGDHAAAARHFEAALQDDPGDATVRLWLGMSYHRLGRLDAARAAFEEAVRLGGNSAVASQARASLQALPGRSGPGKGPGSSSARSPSGWRLVGPQQGLEGEDWQVRDTRFCRVWARKGDQACVEAFLGDLDRAYALNAAFMGGEALVPIEFYCFPLASPAHRQPRFASTVGARTRFAGLAVGRSLCLINLGDWRDSYHYEPWVVAQTVCHELNHMFFNNVSFRDPSGQRVWLAEALAAAVQDRLMPAGRRRTLESVRLALKGYQAVDADWRALVSERDNPELEQYRTYDVLLASIVYFFEARFGSDAVARLLRTARGRSLDEAFVATFGGDVPALHEGWKAFYGIR